MTPECYYDVMKYHRMTPERCTMMPNYMPWCQNRSLVRPNYNSVTSKPTTMTSGDTLMTSNDAVVQTVLTRYIILLKTEIWCVFNYKRSTRSENFHVPASKTLFKQNCVNDIKLKIQSYAHKHSSEKWIFRRKATRASIMWYFKDEATKKCIK